MFAVIEVVGADVLCQSSGSAVPERRIAGCAAKGALEAWSKRYDSAARRDDTGELLAIGREMLLWLDGNGWAEAWMAGAGSRVMHIRVDDPGDPLARALLDAPWELLANKHSHLIDDLVQIFEVARRVGMKADIKRPHCSDLRVLFMAAAPEHVSELDFEAEEAAIVEATHALPMDLVVEESGTAAYLSERLALDGPFEVLHLVCHGDIDGARGPVLALEDDVGCSALADIGSIAKCLGDEHQMPALVFLSACRTAEQRDLGEYVSESFVRGLVRAGVANVLGWDGSVRDSDATAFASVFYEELSRHTSVVRAAAIARHRMRLTARNSSRHGAHWHLARLYLGVQGGGPLTAKEQPRRKFRGAQFERQFLDEARGEVPVAKRSEFVGRRRHMQAVLKAFRNSGTGVLIHGMASMGKSSLAARVASRMVGHRTVVIFGNYDAVTVFDRVLEALPPEGRAHIRGKWREQLRYDPMCLAEAMESMLEDQLDSHPILLIVDDLERILEVPAPGDPGFTSMLRAYRATYLAVQRAFASATTASRLLITSRYRFTLLDSRGDEAAESLLCVQISPMTSAEQRKQLLAKLRLADAAASPTTDMAMALRAVTAAGGNPGLQADLVKALLSGETAVAQEAIESIEQFRAALPSSVKELIKASAGGCKGSVVAGFFNRMGFDVYRSALSDPQALLLSAACLFEGAVGIPRPVIEAMGSAAGVLDCTSALDRLLGLGMVDNCGTDLNGTPYVAVNILVRPLVPRLDSLRAAEVASAAVPIFADYLNDSRGEISIVAESVELVCLALMATTVSGFTLSRAAAAAAAYVLHVQHDARDAWVNVLKPVLTRMDSMGAQPTSAFLQIMFDCADRLGYVEERQRAVRGMDAPSNNCLERGRELLLLGRHHANTDLDKAESCYLEAASIFLEVGEQREWAFARAGISDILEARCEYDQALHIRHQEELPVYERMGDLRSFAITQGKIADVLLLRGQLDEALHICQEVQLPVYDRLGDMLQKGQTLGQIANIMCARGELDSALRIRQEEEWPIYEKLGNVYFKAIAQGQIADILCRQGRLNEALRLYMEEQLPVYERLGAVRQRAITLGRIASILQARGRFEEALRIRQEEVLPVLRRFGDVRSIALVHGKIAEGLEDRGQLDEALWIREKEELPIFERLGDEHAMAGVYGSIAGILEARGQLDTALRIRQEKELPVYERMGDAYSLAISKGRITDTLQARGRFDEALQILREEILPVFERVGDVFARAVTLRRIANILQRHGRFREALRILQEEELPVYEEAGRVYEVATTHQQIACLLAAHGEFDKSLQILRVNVLPVFRQLGHVRSLAVAQCKLAEILQNHGQLDEALRIYEEQVPIYERLGDERSKAGTLGSIAEILYLRGHLKDALRIHREERLPIYERLGVVHLVATTQGSIADILQRRGELDEAMRIRLEDELPVYDRLNDIHAMLVTLGSIGDILQASGNLDEALSIRNDVLLGFERLGDAHAVAVSREKAATILEARGQVSEAEAQYHASLSVFRKVGDVLGVARVRHSLARTRLASQRYTSEGLKEILEDLQKSFETFVKLGVPDGIGYVGLSLARAMTLGGWKNQALTILGLAEDAFRNLGSTQGAAAVTDLKASIEAQ